MSLTLDSATEQRIQRELARGPYREPAEVISRALDLLEATTKTSTPVAQHFWPASMRASPKPIAANSTHGEARAELAHRRERRA